MVQNVNTVSPKDVLQSVKIEVTVTKDVFVDRLTGRAVPFMIYETEIAGQVFRLVPKEGDKKMLNYFVETLMVDQQNANNA